MEWDDEIDEVEESTESNDVFEVSRLLKKRIRQNTVEYLVKWRNFPSACNSWEPERNILSLTLIERFIRRQKRRRSSSRLNRINTEEFQNFLSIQLERYSGSSQRYHQDQHQEAQTSEDNENEKNHRLEINPEPIRVPIKEEKIDPMMSPLKFRI